METIPFQNGSSEMSCSKRCRFCQESSQLYYQVADRGHFRSEMVRGRQVAIYSSAAIALAAERQDLAVGRNILRFFCLGEEVYKHLQTAVIVDHTFEFTKTAEARAQLMRQQELS